MRCRRASFLRALLYAIAAAATAAETLPATTTRVNREVCERWAGGFVATMPQGKISSLLTHVQSAVLRLRRASQPPWGANHRHRAGDSSNSAGHYVVVATAASAAEQELEEVLQRHRLQPQQSRRAVGSSTLECERVTQSTIGDAVASPTDNEQALLCDITHPTSPTSIVGRQADHAKDGADEGVGWRWSKRTSGDGEARMLKPFSHLEHPLMHPDVERFYRNATYSALSSSVLHPTAVRLTAGGGEGREAAMANPAHEAALACRVAERLVLHFPHAAMGLVPCFSVFEEAAKGATTATRALRSSSSSGRDAGSLLLAIDSTLLHAYLDPEHVHTKRWRTDHRPGMLWGKLNILCPMVLRGLRRYGTGGDDGGGGGTTVRDLHVVSNAEVRMVEETNPSTTSAPSGGGGGGSSRSGFGTTLYRNVLECSHGWCPWFARPEDATALHAGG